MLKDLVQIQFFGLCGLCLRAAKDQMDESFKTCKSTVVVVYFQAFPGNSNADSVVLHKLQQPVITRYVRIIPDRNRSGRIGLRLETYGCPYGQFGLLFSLSFFFFFYFCLQRWQICEIKPVWNTYKPQEREDVKGFIKQVQKSDVGFSCVSESDVVGFDGSSSLLYSLSPWSKPATADSISLKFKTLRNSGILLHMEGQSENSLSLQLHRGKLLLLLQKGAAANSSCTCYFIPSESYFYRAKQSLTNLHLHCIQFLSACVSLVSKALREISPQCAAAATRTHFQNRTDTTESCNLAAMHLSFTSLLMIKATVECSVFVVVQENKITTLPLNRCSFWVLG